MFIQVILGRTNDRERLTEQNERWGAELAPGAPGHLGATGGIADDGTVVILARFESEDAARANSERPEQGQWWSETASCFDGDVTFLDCPEVDVEQRGDLDEAGFVQILQGTAVDKAKVRALLPGLMDKIKELRPEILGGVFAWDGDHFTQAVYFTDEAAARAGEQKMADGLPELAELDAVAQTTTFIDLRDPWISSA